MIKRFTIQVLAVLFVFSMSWANNNFRQSIVKIYTVQDHPSYDNPWNTLGPDSKNGSGAVISGNRILTSAHVVENSTFIQVRLYGSAKRYEANVVAISHEADLAILEVDDPTIFDEVQPF